MATQAPSPHSPLSKHTFIYELYHVYPEVNMHVSTWMKMEIARRKSQKAEEEFQCNATLIKEHGIGNTEENNE